MKLWEHKDGSDHSANGPLGCFPCANHRRSSLKLALTDKQLSVLRRLAGGDEHIRGQEVRVVRRLEFLGLATLRDDGAFGPRMGRGNADGERWYASITISGRLVVRSKR